MKYFEKDGRYNFVDDNNVLVGYYSDSICCEKFGFILSHNNQIIYYWKRDSHHFISPFSYNFDIRNEKDMKELESYSFDVNYFEEIKDENCESNDIFAVCFKLTHKNINFGSIFLILYNLQNGYYSHGFSMDVGGKTIKSGKI